MKRLNEKDKAAQMADMRSFDEPMPCVGAFSFDSGTKLAEPIQAELSELLELLEQEFSLPYFEFVYDEHWDLGHERVV